MKKLTCKDLGGCCDEAFTGDSFGEIGQKCHAHVVEQINSGDQDHLAAAEKMKNASPEEQQAMMADYQKKYDEAVDE